MIVEIYFFFFRLQIKHRKWWLFHSMGFWSFALSAIKHHKRKNIYARNHQVRAMPKQLLCAIRRFPK